MAASSSGEKQRSSIGSMNKRPRVQDYIESRVAEHQSRVAEHQTRAAEHQKSLSSNYPKTLADQIQHPLTYYSTNQENLEEASE